MKSIKIYLLCFLVALLSTSCNLDETLYSEVKDGDYYATSTQVITAAHRPWAHFCGIMTFGNSNWLLQELSADGAAWPQKGRHGYDGGRWIRLHRHAWTAIDDQVVSAWENLYQAIGYSNKIIADLEPLDFEKLKVPLNKQHVIAELKVYRAYCYWHLMDLYADVPLPTSIEIVNPTTRSRAEVFAFIEKEIKDNVNLLSEDTKKTYGRVSKWGAYALLARLYLNAEVYTGTPRWNDCIAACDSVTNSSKFELDSDWNTPFKVDNDVRSKENIWVVVFDRVYAGGFGWYQRWMHYAHQKGWGLQEGTWNGVVIQPSFFDSFDDTDKRKSEGMLFGQQYVRVKNVDGSYSYSSTKLKGSEEYKDEDLILVNTIISMEEGKENSGARSIKYEMPEGAAGNQSNDWVLFRYADIVMMKAEALMRLNNNVSNQNVVNLVNSVRKRAFAPNDPKAVYTPATLTYDEFLAERGREFAFEGFRRSDLIRFNKFVTTSWWDKIASNNPKLHLFPIPTRQLDANPNLKPNIAN